MKVTLQVQAIGKTHRIRSMDDPTIKSGVFLIDLLYSLDPLCINYGLVTPGQTGYFQLILLTPSVEQQQLNAKYVINVTWKLGVPAFILWEDIAEVRSKMIHVLLNMLMLNCK